MSVPLTESPLEAHEQARLSAMALTWSDQQRLWASGFLAGMAAAGQPALAPQPAAKPLATVLYGSQTGNGQAVAERLAAAAENRGLAVTVKNMADYAPAKIKQEKFLFLVVSTHGEGDPPDDAEELWSYLGSERAPKLTDLKYAVLALGDSSYANFCQTGRDFDQRLAALGASELHARVECDVDYLDAAAAWQDRMLEIGEEFLRPEPAVAPRPMLRAVPAAPRHTRERPFAAELLANQTITGRDSDKDVRHLELSLAGAGIEYQPGDSLAVVPRNPKQSVEGLLQAARLDADEAIELDGETLPLAKAFTERLEITRLSPPLLKAYAELGAVKSLRALLSEPDALRGYLERHQVADLVADHPFSIGAQDLVSLLRPLGARSYSIASAPAEYPDEAHLTVSVLREEGRRLRLGAASNHLAALEAGAEVQVYLDANPRFRLPDDPATPIIMIGPGTGVAPYRAFLQQREASGAPGRNWLFFGDRHFASDFLYQIEWLRWRKQGLLNRLDVAFSRDQEQKIYVQHRLREQGAEIYRWLVEGAWLYVCGDAKAMAPDVHQALIDIAAAEGGTEHAQEFVQQLKREGRYRRDVY